MVEGELMDDQEEERTLGEFLEETALAALPGCIAAQPDSPDGAAHLAWLVAEHFCIHAKAACFERIEKIYSIIPHQD